MTYHIYCAQSLYRLTYNPHLCKNLLQMRGKQRLYPQVFQSSICSKRSLSYWHNRVQQRKLRPIQTFLWMCNSVKNNNQFNKKPKTTQVQISGTSIDLDMSNFELLLMFSTGKRNLKTQNKYSKFNTSKSIDLRLQFLLC